MTAQQTTPTSTPGFDSPKDAKAQAKADKAYRKASRPWFKKKRFILLAVIVLFAIIKGATGGGDAGTSESANSVSPPAAAKPAAAKPAAAKPAAAKPAAAKPAAAEAGIGAKVRDGKYEFVVTAVERPGNTIKGQFGTSETAQGEFVIVRVNVTNIGDEAQTLMSTGQLLFNDKGQKFEPSSAMLTLKDADKFFLKNINPGNTVTGAPLLFDVAPGTNIASIELHDSMFSGGVKVKLS